MSSSAKNIVFVHGMAGWGPKDLGGKFPYWGEALAQFGPEFRVFEAKCGPVSSLHDRACEVFAQIFGTRVDYGEAHGAAAGHARFSRDYSGAGFVPDWSAENPVAIVGHSAGAPTALLLQRLLADDFWGLGTSADWIETVVSIAGALNGSTFAYRFCDDANGRMIGLPSAFVARGLDLLARVMRLSSTPVLDLYLDQWTGDAGAASALQRLDASRFVASADNLVHDMSLQGARETLERCTTFPQTHYLAFVACATRRARRFGLPFGVLAERPAPAMGLRQRYGGRYICTRPEFSAAPIEGWGAGELTMERWRANDGCVNTISQRHPLLGGAHPVGGEGVLARADIAPGRWYYENIEDVVGRAFDHLDPVHGAFHKPSRKLREAHRRLYREIAQTLRRLRATAR